MEIVTLLLTSLLTLISPVGWVTDLFLAQTLRSQLSDAEILAVRVDNRPSYQLLTGQVDQIRIAGRGLRPWSYLRVDTLELETDPIALDWQGLDGSDLNAIKSALQDPFQGAMRLVLTEADLNQALNAPEVRSQLQALINEGVTSRLGADRAIELTEIQLQFLSENRVSLKLQARNLAVSSTTSPLLEIELQVGFQLQQGRSLRLVDLQGSFNGRALSSRLLQGFAEGLSDRLDLQTLEASGVLVRLLQLELSPPADPSQLQLAAFVRIDPKTQKAAPGPAANLPRFRSSLYPLSLP